jgi:Fe-S oxidoreductase
VRVGTESAIAPFESREDAGIDTCTTCPKLCRWACPVAEAEARETTSPWNLVTMSGLMKRGVAPPQAMADLAYHCSQCGACTEACLHRNDVPLLLSLARSRSLAAHVAPEGVSEVRGHFAVANNTYGQPLDKNLEQLLAGSESGQRISASAKTVYLPGCVAVAERPEAAASFLRTLALRGISGVGVSPVSSECCGLPLFWAGDLEGFRAHAQRYAERLQGVEKLIVHDAACADAFRRRYVELGVRIPCEVEHVSRFLAGSLAIPPEDGDPEGPAPREAPSSGPIAYMDTCHLTRCERAIATPRRLIARATGSPPVELAGMRGIRADCCGAAGLLPVTAPDTARAMAEARLDAFRSSGAQTLAVMSPRCAAHLSRVDPSAEVIDVSTLLARLK